MTDSVDGFTNFGQVLQHLQTGWNQTTKKPRIRVKITYCLFSSAWSNHQNSNQTVRRVNSQSGSTVNNNNNSNSNNSESTNHEQSSGHSTKNYSQYGSQQHYSHHSQTWTNYNNNRRSNGNNGHYSRGYSSGNNEVHWSNQKNTRFASHRSNNNYSGNQHQSQTSPPVSRRNHDSSNHHSNDQQTYYKSNDEKDFEMCFSLEFSLWKWKKRVLIMIDERTASILKVCHRTTNRRWTTQLYRISAQVQPTRPTRTRISRILVIWILTIVNSEYVTRRLFFRWHEENSSQYLSFKKE